MSANDSSAPTSMVQLIHGRGMNSKRPLVRRPACLGFILIFFAILTLPMASQLLGIGTGIAGNENRALNPLPELPKTLKAASHFPEAFERYFNDHFGLRAAAIAANGWIRYHLFSEFASPQIVSGRNGRIFLGSHSANTLYELIRFSCGLSTNTQMVRKSASQFEAFVSAMRQINSNMLFAVIPVSSTIYPDDVPEWLAAQCSRAIPPGLEFKSIITERDDLSKHYIYPLGFMNFLKETIEVYPRFNFHWDGVAPRRVAEFIATRRFGRAQELVIDAYEQTVESDLSDMMPGVRLTNRIAVPNYAGAGVEACRGASCLPELGGIAATLIDVSRYRSKATGGRKLLLVSDSFGAYVAGYFSQFYSEVWHVSTNHASRLSQSELEQMRGTVLESYQPDDILFLYHDPGAITMPSLLTKYFVTRPSM